MTFRIANEQISAKVRGHEEDVSFFVVEEEGFIAGGAIALVHIKASNKGRENAKFIVRACNAHDDLVKALQGVIRVADRDTDEFNFARYALAKAGAA